MAGQKKTSFDGMTHEQMLAWLDEADAGTVQAAADRLTAAAKEIHSIADELKVRPQWVKWKGEGADSFRQWASKLATATVALGDYSQDSSKWLGHAAGAISKAKTSVPRDKGVDANIDAARSAHNDPDSQTILSKNMAVRQQTADELEKLGQAYSLSSSQMAAARKPELLKFPPPPTDIQDPEREKLDGGAYRRRPGTGVGAPGPATGRAAASPGGSGSREMAAEGHAESAGSDQRAVGSVPSAVGHPRVDTPPASTNMDIDSVGVVPDAPQTHAPTPGSPTPSPTGPHSGATGTPVPGLAQPIAYGNGGGRGTRPVTGTARGVSPATGGGTGPRTNGPTASGATGRPTGTGPRGTMMPGQSAQATGRAGGSGSPGRLPTNNGVAGGRPQPTTGRSSSSIPRGTVMGGGNATAGRGGTPGQGASAARPGVMGSSSAGTAGSAGRPTSGAAGRNGGIVGGRPQQQNRSSARSFSPGGSGLVRGQNGGKGASPEDPQRTTQAGRTGAGPHGSRPGSRQDEERSERADYVTEDEQTWLPDDRRNVPTVIDDADKNSER